MIFLPFSDFFGEMMNATGDIQRNLSYLSTHPMFEERIANIKNRTNINDSKIINTTDDYKFIKNILKLKKVVFEGTNTIPVQQKKKVKLKFAVNVIHFTLVNKGLLILKVE